MDYCIGVDLGGTNIAVGIIDLQTKKIIKKASIKTKAPRSCEEISLDIVNLCSDLSFQRGLSLKNMKWIGIATPGTVHSGVVSLSGNLGWENAPIVKCVRELSGVKTFATNDAHAAAYAEYMWGAGKGMSSLVIVTIGTGVGGAFVFGGRIWGGNNAFAGEIGHMILEMNGRPCSCGKLGCLEAYCSSRAIIRRCREMMRLYPYSLMWQVCGGDIDKVNASTPFRAKELGDAAADMIIDEFVRYLSMGVSNIINILQPDIVCIGGGLSAEGDLYIHSLRNQVEQLSFGYVSGRTKIELAEYKNNAGIIGGALLGLQEKFK